MTMNRSVASVLLIFLLLAVSGAIADDKKEKPAVKTFTNSKEGLKGEKTDRLKHYVDFSFDYPATWEVKDTSKGDNNFVKVERSIQTEQGPITQENFAVGLFYTSGDADQDKKLLPKVYAQLIEQTKGGFPKYKTISEGERKLGGYTGYEIKFTSEIDVPKIGKIELYGCWHLLPNPNGGTKGVAICYLGTNKAAELKGIEDLGVKGDLPGILKSFKFGKD